MTQQEKLTAIKAEIERLRHDWPKVISDGEKNHLWMYFRGLNRIRDFIDSLPEEPVGEDLEKAAEDYGVRQGAELKPFAIKDFKAGAQWKEEQFEKNRLEHCNSITNEQAELEQSFIDQHLDKNDRMPTFLDANEYGMRLQKEQKNC